MNKLLVGDVGSGKTIVAALACGLMAMSGRKSVVLCPTQVLAGQHFKTISEFLGKFNISVGLMTSKHKSDGQVIIGTHALITRGQIKKMPDLALVVIDEEQRFGVLQRSQFLGGKKWPHMLSLTATPIPRTIAMMNLGNVSYSYLSEKPKDRKEIKTYVVDDTKREKMLEFCVTRALEHDERIFYVCPLIEAGTKGRNATAVYKDLTEYWGKKIKVGLLHGRTEEGEKQKIMQDFRDGKIQVLVSTTVIEVGVDVPRATVMIIDSAEQFGLSQLHQLRGRVGRDGSQGYCFLINIDPESKDRLGVLVKESDGLAIAKKDLLLRGPGDVFGLDQSGKWDTNFEAFWDGEVNENAKSMAQMIALDEPRSMEILAQINPSLANFDLPN
jgi:ATP-dependent DNA helicase RecG